MKIVVTGANGFIGRHIIPRLIDKNIDVIAVVRDLNKSKDLNQLCKVVEHEIGVEDELLYSKLNNPDVLLHLAWGGLPDYKSLQHINTELPKHYNFIFKMVESGIKSVSVVGTCFEYGMLSGPLSENMETKPGNAYGYAKDALRKQLQFLQKESDFMFTWMRLFYMYGDDQPMNTLYSQFRQAVKNNDSVFDMSGGEQLRDYLPIDEVVNKITKLILTRGNIGVVNVCSGEPISIRSLVEKWRIELESGISLNFGHYPYPDYEPMAFWGDIEKYKNI